MTTLTGSVVTLTGVAAQTTLYFSYLSAPSNVDGSLVKSNAFTVITDDNGNFSTPIRKGDYSLSLSPQHNGVDTWRFSIGSASGSIDISQVLSGNGAIKWNPSTGVPNASANVPGVIKTTDIVATGASSPTGTPASLFFWDSTAKTLWLNSNGVWTSLITL